MKGQYIVHVQWLCYDQILTPANSPLLACTPLVFPAPNTSSCHLDPASLSDKLRVVSILVQGKWHSLLLLLLRTGTSAKAHELGNFEQSLQILVNWWHNCWMLSRQMLHTGRYPDKISALHLPVCCFSGEDTTSHLSQNHGEAHQEYHHSASRGCQIIWRKHLLVVTSDARERYYFCTLFTGERS